MLTKRAISAVHVVFVVLVVAGALIHRVWLGSTYQAMRDNGFSFRSPEAIQHRLWLIWLADLLYATLFVWIYVRGREEKAWENRGLRYGVLMTLFTVVPSALQQYAAYDLKHILVVKWMVADGMVLIIFGFVVAAIFRKQAV